MTPSQAKRKKKAKRKRAPREHYDTSSYRRAVHRACDRAGVGRWNPHQLRHNAGTTLSKEYGIEAARVILGHKCLAATAIYAEMDRGKAIEIMGEVG